MTKEELYSKLKSELDSNLDLLIDKPEENIDSTLKTLWLASSGLPKSVEEANKLSMPELNQQQILILQDMIKQRLQHIPLAYITGKQSFMGIEFLSDQRALIPRKETEILGRMALELSRQITDKKNNLKVFDVCCGAGNLGLAIASYNENAIVFSSDLSQEAVDLTSENIKMLDLNNRVSVHQGDMFSPYESDKYFNTVDLIICNPPYISSSKVPKMDSEISKNEPFLAFDGGLTGTNIIFKLINESPRFLTNGGWLIFEIGLGQGPFIMKFCERSESFARIESVTDALGNIRVILAQKV